jgi:hypothetical protein
MKNRPSDWPVFFRPKKRSKDRSLRQRLHWDSRFPVGAAEGCDLLILLSILKNQDQKIAAFGSSYARFTPLVRPVMPILVITLEIQEKPCVDCACTGHTGKTTIIKS